MAVAEPSTARRIDLTLRDGIAHGVFDRDRELPREQTLGRDDGVSRATLPRVLASLENDGGIERQRGASAFPSESGSARPIADELSAAITHLVAMGYTTHVSAIGFEYRAPTQAAAA